MYISTILIHIAIAAGLKNKLKKKTSRGKKQLARCQRCQKCQLELFRPVNNGPHWYAKQAAVVEAANKHSARCCELQKVDYKKDQYIKELEQKLALRPRTHVPWSNNSDIVSSMQTALEEKDKQLAAMQADDDFLQRKLLELSTTKKELEQTKREYGKALGKIQVLEDEKSVLMADKSKLQEELEIIFHLTDGPPML